MKPETTPRRTAVYCRVSTDMEMQEGSFALQQAYYRDYISARPDLILTEIYGDRGCTGRSINRPAFRRMLADCEQGQIDLILTKSISRFARNVGDCVAVVRRLRAMGVPVVFEKEGINTMEGQGELLLTILAALAQEESNSLSQNILWANEQHNASGRPHFKPSYGYRKERRDWIWQIDEAAARRVCCAFARAAEGVCYREIRRELNAMEAAEHTGLEWTLRRLKYTLTNISYTGDCLTNKNVARGWSRGSRPNLGEKPQYLIEDHHAPLVSRATFDQVQRNMAAGLLNTRELFPHRRGRSPEGRGVQ